MNHMIRLAGAIVAFLAVVIPQAAQAGTVICTARVQQIGLAADGAVFPSLEGLGWPLLCNLNVNLATSRGQISPEQCKAILSNLMTAKATGKTVSL